MVRQVLTFFTVLGFAVVGIVLYQRMTGTVHVTHPIEDPKPGYFVTVKLIEPRHAQFLADRKVIVRIQVVGRELGSWTTIPLCVKLDDHLLSRDGKRTQGECLMLKSEETEIVIETQVDQGGLHTLAVGTEFRSFLPLVNGTIVKFATR